jgi:hypothetical protein
MRSHVTRAVTHQDAGSALRHRDDIQRDLFSAADATDNLALEEATRG